MALLPVSSSADRRSHRGEGGRGERGPSRAQPLKKKLGPPTSPEPPSGSTGRAGRTEANTPSLWGLLLTETRDHDSFLGGGLVAHGGSGVQRLLPSTVSPARLLVTLSEQQQGRPQRPVGLAAGACWSLGGWTCLGVADRLVGAGSCGRNHRGPCLPTPAAGAHCECLEGGGSCMGRTS